MFQADDDHGGEGVVVVVVDVVVDDAPDEFETLSTICVAPFTAVFH